MRIEITLRHFEQITVWALQDVSLGYHGGLTESGWTVASKREAIDKLNEVYELTKIKNEEEYQKNLKKIMDIKED